MIHNQKGQLVIHVAYTSGGHKDYKGDWLHRGLSHSFWWWEILVWNLVFISSGGQFSCRYVISMATRHMVQSSLKVQDGVSFFFKVESAQPVPFLPRYQTLTVRPWPGHVLLGTSSSCKGPGGQGCHLEVPERNQPAQRYRKLPSSRYHLRKLKEEVRGPQKKEFYAKGTELLRECSTCGVRPRSLNGHRVSGGRSSHQEQWFSLCVESGSFQTRLHPPQLVNQNHWWGVWVVSLDVDLGKSTNVFNFQMSIM